MKARLVQRSGLVAFLLATSTAAEDLALRRDETTLVVSVTSTTTVHATAASTATDGSGAAGPCADFSGACVVYGGQGSAAYTTTVYANSPSASPVTTIYPSSATPTSTLTKTTTVLATTTVGDEGACRGFDGACVVYGSAGGTQTVYAGQTTSQGNAEGFIGATATGRAGGGGGGGEGFIGGAGEVRVPGMMMGIGVGVGIAAGGWL